MFDPYHKWLGIPKKHRPPTHYQLLGIEPEEKDSEVIEEAAIRQSAHLRTYQIGEHGELCTRLLDEISQARTTLLNPAKRKLYDTELAKKAPKPRQSIQKEPPREESNRAFADLDDSDGVVRPRYRGADADRSGRHRRPDRPRPRGKPGGARAGSNNNQLMWIGAGAGGLVVVLVLVAVLLSGSSDSGDKEKDKSDRVARNDDNKQPPPRDRRPDPNVPINPPPNRENPINPMPMGNEPVNPPPDPIRNQPPIDPNPPVDPPQNPMPMPVVARATEVAHLQTPGGEALGDFVVLPNKQEVILAHDRLETYNLTTKKRVRVFANALPGRFPGKSQLALTSNNAKLVSILNGSASVYVHDVATGKSLGEIFGHNKGTRGFALIPGGTQIATIARNHLRVWDVNANRSVISSAREPVAISLSPDGKLLYAPRGDGLDIYDLRTKERSFTPLTGGRMRSLAVGPLGTVAIAMDARDANGQDNVLLMSSSLGIKQRIPTTSKVYDLGFSAKEKYLVAAGENGYLTVWDLESYKPVCQVTGHVGTVSRARFSADGRQVYACDSSGHFRIWQLPDNVRAPGESPDAGATEPMTPPATNNTAGLIAHWSFDEGRGGHATDSSRNRLRATLNGVRWTKGVRGNAVEIPKQGAYVDLGRSSVLNFKAGAPFTAACWAKSTAPGGTILSFRRSTDSSSIINLFYAAGKPMVWVRQDNGRLYPDEPKGVRRIDDGAWHHFTAIRQPDSTVQLYVDGALVAESGAMGARNLRKGSITTDLRIVGMEPIWVQKMRLTDRNDFVGCVDELCFFNRALTKAEIAKLAGRAP